MKDISTCLVAVFAVVIAIRYAYLIKARKIELTVSTWIIFLVGTLLSATTYTIAEKHDFKSGILNVVDVGEIVVVLVSLCLWGKHGIRLKRFEKWYLAGAAIIVGYGFVSGDAWSSNILTQILITIGYVPTVHKLCAQKVNSESWFGWGGSFASSAVAIYPAVVDGNALAVIYAARAAVLTVMILSIMGYYEFIFRRNKEDDRAVACAND